MAAWMPKFEDALGPEQRLELRLRYRGTVVVEGNNCRPRSSTCWRSARRSEMNAGIVLELSRAERNGVAGCRIAVIDHGEGMTDEVARQAVAPFFTTRQPGKGMGLGLTIARMVAEAHGGTLEIDSAFGRGTTVSIYLPNAEARYAAEAASNLAHGVAQRRLTARTRRPGLRLPVTIHGRGAARGAVAAGRSQGERAGGPSQAARPSSHSVPVPQSGGPLGGPGRRSAAPPAAPRVGAPAPAPHTPCVLVVDDEEAIAEYFRIILSAEHYDVQVVTSAHQALDRFAEDPSRSTRCSST